MRGDERAEIAALGHYWDEAARGGRADLGAVDPSLTGVVDRLRALDASEVTPSPDAAFVRRLEGDLMHVFVTVRPAATPTSGNRPTDRQPTLPIGWGRRESGRVPRRAFPFAQLLTAAVVLLTLSSAVFAYRLLPANGGQSPAPPAVQPGWDRPGPDVPPASACQTAPAPVERRKLTGTPELPAAVPVVPDPSIPGEHALVPLDSLPDGRPAEEQTVAAITATLRALLACFNAGDDGRHAAFFTEDYWRRRNALDVNFGLDPRNGPRSAFLSSTRGPGEPELAVPALVDVRLLGDGRVSALVIPRDVPEGDGSRFGHPLSVVLVEGDGRWLIDEAVQVNAIANVIQTVEYPLASLGPASPVGGNAPAPDASFDLVGIEPGADAPLLLVIHNREQEPLTFAIDEIGVRVDVAPGRFVPVVVEAPAGSYRYTGSLAGRSSAGLTGRLVLHPTGTPAPATPDPSVSPTLTIESFDLGFDPAVVAIPADTEVVVTLRSQGTADHTFTVDALGIDVSVAAGETREVTIDAPAGEYEFYSRAPEHREAGMVGTLVVGAGAGGTPPATPTAATPIGTDG